MSAIASISRRAARTSRGLVLACVVAAGGLAGCQDQAAVAEQQARALAAAAELEAGKAEVAFESAFAAGNWPLAKAQGDVLIARYPQSQAAQRIAPRHAEAQQKANAAREDARLAGLWAYQSQPVGKRQQLSAAIYARDPVDVDGSGAKPVRLIFRDHPEWGRSSYLVLEAGDFRCAPACRVPVATDDGAPQRMAANRPKTDEAIAMFIDDQRALWRRIDGAKTLSIEFLVASGGTRTAVFEVGGLDRAKLPGWD